ncbi:MAG: hypothetical protein AB1896_04330 [Thermodesulfobacteriota bacterium]
MKLFDLSLEEKLAVKKFLAWHFGYVAYVGLLAFAIYYFRLFKAHWFLKEYWILNLVSPLHTLFFIVISPYRRDWLVAVKNMYLTLEGEPVFCLMALLLALVGFYLYNAVIWGLGSLIPSIFFT